jgi:YggT family protein
MDVVLLPLINVISIALNLYMWALIISAILSWLVAFNVVNTSNQFVYSVGNFLHRITEPVLRPIRNILPEMGGIDLSPMVLILGIYFLQGLLAQLAMRVAMGSF